MGMEWIVSILIIIGINVILAVSLNLINGVTGQFSLGHAGFMAVGAYSSAVLVKMAGINMIGAIVLAGIMASIIGFVVGYPVLRLKGDYLAIVTLGFGEIIRVVILNLEVVGGASGYADIPMLGGRNYFITMLVVYIFVILTVVIIRNIMVSSEGRALISIREDEIASESMGVNITKYKVLAFIIGAFFAGIAGALYAHYYQYIKPDSFGMYKTVDILLMVVLGGMGSMTGSVVAAVLLSLIPEGLRLAGLADYRMIVYSVMLIGLILVRPNGLFGKKELSDFISFKKKGGREDASGS